ncbi:hypothetical protein [Gordonia terrae]
MTIPTTVSHDEIVGRLIRQIDEVAGPDALTSVTLYSDSHEVVIHRLDPFRYELHCADDLDAPIRIWDTRLGQRCLTVRRTTLLKALQDTAATLAFPVTTGARLRVIDGGEPA